MRFAARATALLFAICCADAVAAGRVFELRDDKAPATTNTNPTPSKETPSPAETKTPAPTKSDISSETQQPSTTISTSPSSTTLPKNDTTAITTSAPLAQASLAPNGTSIDGSGDMLPLTPIITPAMAIAGVLLIIAGITLCLVGIKHKMIHVFLSTALLTALAVSVLIVYVMNPPVSNAIQGAYLVAAVVTGLVFGGISIVFKEVTEGFGCLLGGFCVAMWFLVLKDGGLIASTAGRAIMIAAFTIAAFALSFSTYTRTYGLIACTAFAGATVAILGIDCFSRAGLKEFWIYLWNLNTNEFPLNTNTYPITRGIRVEIACTVVLCIFGALSQLKIWKIVKERRSKRDAERLQDDEDRDILERALGTKIEKSNRKDLRRWEHLYGRKGSAASDSQFDSGVGSSIHTSKKSASIHAREIDDVELATMPSFPPKAYKRESDPHGPSGVGIPSVRVLEAHEDDEEWGRSVMRASAYLEDEADDPMIKALASKPSEDRLSVQAKSVRDSGPAVTPLPFAVPAESDFSLAASDNESIASKSQRHSGMQPIGVAGMPAMVPHIDEDQATSVAANADDVANFETLSLHRLSVNPFSFDFNSASEENPTTTYLDTTGIPTDEKRISFIEAPVEENDEEAIVRPPTSAGPARPTSDLRIRPASNLSVRTNQQRFSSGSNGALTENPHGGTSVVGSLHGHLPANMSKVAMTYRTNEWAKHIADAEEPEDVDLEASSPGIKVDPVFAEETARAVDVDALREDVSPTDPAQVPRRSASQLSSRNPYRNSAGEARPATSHRNSGGSAVTPVHAFAPTRKGSQPHLNRSTSNNSLRQDMQRGQRSVTSPVTVQPIQEMPLTEAALTRKPSNNRLGAMPFGSTVNLLDERNDRIKAMPKTTSLMGLGSTSTPNLMLMTSPTTQMPQESAVYDSPQEFVTPMEGRMTFDEEDMTLSQRKALIRANSQSQNYPIVMDGVTSPIHSRRVSVNSYHGTPSRIRSNSHQIASMNNPDLIYDSHQPQRTKTIDAVKQANMLTQWRQSLEPNASTRQPVLMHDNAHNTLLVERRQKEWANQQRQAEQINRQSAMDMAMRTGQMNNAHRDAMRRMQAKANRESQL